MEEALKTYEELQKANEKLKQMLRGWPVVHDSGANHMLRVNIDPQPFTKKIMEEQVLPHFMVLKMTPYLGSVDLETHLKAFEAQMLISRGFDAIRCKMFVGTLTGTALQWFSRISDDMIKSF